MKLNKLAKIVKSSGFLEICNDYGTDTQWVKTGLAMYPLFGMPEFTTGNILYLLDFPTDKQHDIVVTEDAMPYDFDYADTAEGEFILPTPLITIGWKGKILSVIQADSSFYFLRDEYIAPVQSKDTLLFLRRTKSGAPYIAVKEGMLIQAIFMPEEIKDAGRLKRILNDIAYFLPKDEDDETPEVNPETGEVL